MRKRSKIEIKSVERAKKLVTTQLINLYFPTLKEHEMGRFLMRVTGFPLEELSLCLDRLSVLSERSNKDWKRAIEISDGDLRDTFDEMERGEMLNEEKRERETS